MVSNKAQGKKILLEHAFLNVNGAKQRRFKFIVTSVKYYCFFYKISSNYKYAFMQNTYQPANDSKITMEFAGALHVTCEIVSIIKVMKATEKS
jgi:hypothetical protein